MSDVAMSIDALLILMQTLRQQCPWDKAQTPQSLTRYAIEEAYEVEAAIRAGNTAHIQEELGDLLLQVVFQACLFEEQGAFNFSDVVHTLHDKLVRRHPHVFADKTADTAPAVAGQWEAIKAEEKKGKGGTLSLLDVVKLGPALQQAQQLQKVAATVGFDWPDVAGATRKLEEEVTELHEAIALNDSAKITDELGDCFFALVNVARKLGVPSEMALLGTIHKFRSRFHYVEEALATQNIKPAQAGLAKMDTLWNEAKRLC